MATSFYDLASTIIAEMASETDAETSLTFKTTTLTRSNDWEAPTAETEATETVTGFVFGPGTMRFNGELVPEKSQIIFVAAKDLTTTTLGVDTTVSFAGETYATDRFSGIPGGDNPAVYEIIVGVS